MSSFVRKHATSTRGSGTRAGPQGQSLVSTGLADLDQILGGGLALGTLTLICEDVLSPHHLSLLGYFIAEGLNNDQAVLWGASHRSGAVGKLPRVAGLPSRRQAAPPVKGDRQGELRIAWQYRQYLGKSTEDQCVTEPRQPGPASSALEHHLQSLPVSTTTKPFPHEYDLTNMVDADQLASTYLHKAWVGGPGALQSLCERIAAFATTVLAESERVGTTSSSPASSNDNSAPMIRSPASGMPRQQAPDSCTASLEQPSSSSHARRIDFHAAEPPALDVPSSDTSSDAAHGNVHEPPPAGTAAAAGKGTLMPSDALQQAAAATPAGTSSVRPRRVQFSGAGGASHRQAGDAPPDGQAGPGVAARIAVQSLGAPDWLALEGGTSQGPGVSHVEHDLLTCVWQLRKAVKQKPVAALVTFPAGLYSQSLAMRLQHISDCVIGLEAIRDDSPILRIISDPASCVGMLHIRKLPCINSVQRPYPDITAFAVRHRRRRIAITAIEVDPDAEAQASSSGQTAASLLCASPGKPANLDF